MEIKQRQTFGAIVVEALSVQRDPELEIRQLNVTYDDRSQRVTHYYFTGWSDFGVAEKRQLLDLIHIVNSKSNKSNRCGNDRRREEINAPPTVVHCSAGVGRTGTYIAVDTILHLLDKSDDTLANIELDIMGIVYEMRKDRTKMVQTP
ncbi:unnamed protein product, partial [Didymodactylos carnosus]